MKLELPNAVAFIELLEGTYESQRDQRQAFFVGALGRCMFPSSSEVKKPEDTTVPKVANFVAYLRELADVLEKEVVKPVRKRK